MSITTNLKGRLNNTDLSPKNGLMPLFEAIVNSIHSIEELCNPNEAEIYIEIIRVPQASLFLDSEMHEDIIGFKITDTGIGFNEDNFNSFQILDSEHKAIKGCRGVGRLLWLKAFNAVEIDSIFEHEDKYLQRKFSFNSKEGIYNISTEPTTLNKRQTTVYLTDFNEKYRAAVPKTIKVLAKNILEHCLWYFVRSGSCCKIILQDGAQKQDLHDLYSEYMYSSSKSEQIHVKENIFEITHIKFRTALAKSHKLSFCAANRLVKEENLTGKVIAGLTNNMADEEGNFSYACYISSAYLDGKVRPERTAFNLEEKSEDLLIPEEVTFHDIYQAVYPKIQDYLKALLDANILAGKSRLDDYVNNNAPRYRPILRHIPEELLTIDPSISNKDLDIFLHKQLFEVEAKLLEDGHTIMQPKLNEKMDAYQARLSNFLETVSDVKKSDLANYLCHRKVIIDILENAIQRNLDGQYCKEAIIHELIMPMRTESRTVSLDNLWLLDERLAFHDYLASDKSLKSMPITDCQETKEPDILALQIYDEPILVSESQSLPLASIVIIEIKRPMRNDINIHSDKDPITQALSYLKRIREGTVTTSNGRPITNAEDIPGFCYILCDITPKIKELCEMSDLTISSDYMGYFGFHKKYKTYIEVISFDKLILSAKQRNRAFFDKLGLPTT